jgi:hypothetical protein
MCRSGGLYRARKEGHFRSGDQLQSQASRCECTNCMTLVSSSSSALIWAKVTSTIWSLSFPCILGSERTPSLTAVLGLWISQSCKSILLWTIFWSPAVTSDVRNTLRIDFYSLSNSHYCQESPQWSSNIFSIFPICMTHITLTSLLPFEKQSPRPVICYQEISYRSF